jgi:hypothetical protein
MSTSSVEGLPATLPEIELRPLLRMSDDTGMFQHAFHTVPDPNHGYCIDDNCRALIAAVLYARLRGYDPDALPLERYLMFVAYGLNDDNRRFRNFMSYDRRWLEDAGSEDSHARTIWSLGLTVRDAPTEHAGGIARDLFRRGVGSTRAFKFLRPWCYTLLGLVPYLEAEPDDHEAREIHDELAERVWTMYQDHADDDWPWWEDKLTWGNAKVPHAMLLAGQTLERQDMIDAALRALNWCLEIQTAPEGHLTIIGNRGWLIRGNEAAKYDQQPIEAQGFVQALLDAGRYTGDAKYAREAWRCFEWFTGRNDLGLSLLHPETRGCQDGLEPAGVNKNQGAESVLAYILSCTELHLYARDCASD